VYPHQQSITKTQSLQYSKVNKDMKHMDKFGVLADCSSEKVNKKLSSSEAPNVNGESGMVSFNKKIKKTPADEVQFTETYVRFRHGFMTEARHR